MMTAGLTKSDAEQKQKNMNFQVTVKYTPKPISGHTGTAKSPLTIGLSGTMTILQNLALKHQFRLWFRNDHWTEGLLHRREH